MRRHRRELVADGSGADIPCYLRRTSSRGWSPWVAGRLALPARGVEPSSARPLRFAAADPDQVPLLIGRAGRSGPVTVLTAPVGADEGVWRPARFRGEAFFGDDTWVLVLVTARGRSEVAFDGEDAVAVGRRLGV